MLLDVANLSPSRSPCSDATVGFEKSSAYSSNHSIHHLFHTRSFDPDVPLLIRISTRQHIHTHLRLDGFAYVHRMFPNTNGTPVLRPVHS